MRTRVPTKYSMPLLKGKVNMKLGKKLKESRKRQNLTQQQLADMAGVTRRAIVYWENGKKEMSVESADKVFKALHVSIVIGER